jgi:2-methylisocitrate lyase-like PEP mutase family enzyme
MLAAAARIARGVDVPVSVDAEAGYGMEPEALVTALREAGAAGCNLEDTDHASGALRDPSEHAAWLSSVREAASNQGFPLVINARIDVFLPTIRTASAEGSQRELLDEGLGRARAYLEAGADCAFPIGLWEADAVETFAADAPGPVNILGVARAPSIDELGRLGVARVSCGGLLQHQAMDRFREALASLKDNS